MMAQRFECNRPLIAALSAAMAWRTAQEIFHTNQLSKQ